MPMTLTIQLPPEVVELLRVNQARAVLEATLLKLVSEGKLSLARAGEYLEMNRLEAIRWYTEHGLIYPNLVEAELADDLNSAHRV